MCACSLVPNGVVAPHVASSERTSPICAVEYLRPLRGGSQSTLLRATDGVSYVTKFQNNPQGIRILANEMLAGSIAQRLQLPVPQIEAIQVPDWLVEQSSELRLDCSGPSERPFTSGLQFGSRYVGGSHVAAVADYLSNEPESEIVNLADLARCAVLDKWTGNADGRQAVFAQTDCHQKWKCWLIDQGYCFNAKEWDFPDLPLHGIYYRNWVYRNVVGWQSFEPALSLAEAMAIDELWECACKIPPEWYESNSDDLCRLVETLYKRRPLIRSLLTTFRDSSRAPFPNWIS